jgi:adenylosuccinate lyase
MAYKRNPMRAERMCSLSRFLLGLPSMSAHTAATQWFERTLDDSAGRRLYMPQAFLAADGALRLALNIANGLVVNTEVIARAVADYLPFMATENLMMAAVARGADRQEVHERIRRHSHAVTAAIKEGTATSKELVARLQKDPAFAQIDVAHELEPSRYVGRAPQQVEEFIAQEVVPIRSRYASNLGEKTDVDV